MSDKAKFYILLGLLLISLGLLFFATRWWGKLNGF